MKLRRPLWTQPPNVYRWRARAWLVLLIPTMLWWRESVLWVAFLSLYANWSTEVGNWRAARAEQAATGQVPDDGDTDS